MDLEKITTQKEKHISRLRVSLCARQYVHELIEEHDFKNASVAVDALIAFHKSFAFSAPPKGTRAIAQETSLTALKKCADDLSMTVEELKMLILTVKRNETKHALRLIQETYKALQGGDQQ
jgi:hypothetical protein